MSETEQSKTVFETLRSINVNEHTEKKGNLTYLSWSWAWDQFKLAMPDATYQIREFDGRPYLHDPLTGYMVFTEVTAKGETCKMWLPVMDHSNRTLQKPGMTDINKTIMRCLTKNLAMFGLGLYIYAGEDLPDAEDKPKAKGDTSAENRQSTADLWPAEQQEAWYKGAETLFDGEPSVEALFAWEAADGNGKRVKTFHDEARARALWQSYVHALRAGAILDMQNIDGLNELDAFWNKHSRLLKGRLKDLFDEVEQSKNIRKAQLNAGE